MFLLQDKREGTPDTSIRTRRSFCLILAPIIFIVANPSVFFFPSFPCSSLPSSFRLGFQLPSRLSSPLLTPFFLFSFSLLPLRFYL